MGNVTSADNDKVNELLTRRVKKRAASKHHSQRASNSSSTHQQENGRPTSFFIHRQKSTNSSQTHSPTSTRSPRAPVGDEVGKTSPSQAEFYSRTGADYLPLTPTSPTPFYSPSTSATMPASVSSHQTFDKYSSQYAPPSVPPPSEPYHSDPIVIPQQQRPGGFYRRSSATNPSQAPSPTKVHLQQQQQQQLSADSHLLGTSPEAKDWLKQKPTRSSTHLIHQYNFQTHQYYQTPGSVKVVNNTCRNMTGYAHVPALPRVGVANSATTNTTRDSSGLTARFHSASISTPSPTQTTLPKPRPRSISTAAALMSTQPASVDQTGLNDDGPAGSSMTPATETLGSLSSTAAGVHGATDGSQAPAVPSIKRDPRVGKLVMSLSKLNTPSISSLSSTISSVSSSAGSAPGSPLEMGDGTDNAHFNSEAHPLRPSSTLSSLRSLLGNHPQGLSLIESLEEEDDDASDALSDTETGDSDADLVQRTELLDNPTRQQQQQQQNQDGNTPKPSTRRRPCPRFEWMDARKRFSSSSLSTIGIDVKDSQKGQHALWKYIGGGNSHAPLRYDIDRILDSGCGLGEWAMEMAKEYPNAAVYGVDINPNLFPSAQMPVPSNCLFTQSNILSRMSFPDHYFDYVYQRFLYLGLTVDDWPLALKELRRVMKPGGWIELFEPCMRVHRAGPQTREVMRWVSRLLQEERGLDFDFAGEKMQRLCASEEIGFENVRLERLSIPVGPWGGRVGEAMAENMVLMFQNLKSVLLEIGLQPPDHAAQKPYEAMVQSWIRECEQNKSYIDYYILVAQRPL
ncbi:hypothetical protein BG004_004748 [Podila humilis]|nr:hypothetical protein BG004_004748 [Podila humilis]